ncbi:unnamed protein product [Rotaria magnacalcarata]|uniref:Uncharacterized protein n=1 Tax=Rotaria magnacalcarata TaxID=392030 RepID=A0A815D7H6_9BILA|nr:unnamed protein product [Rotaria magnacalcarata]CAF1523881.1 unnamed protein product [Rotaria magnacalcarata]
METSIKYVGTVDWVGKFQISGTCNITGCCCPSSNLIIKSHNITHEGTFNLTGFDCKTHGHQGHFSIDNVTATVVSVASLGTFTMKNKNDLEILLEQNTTTAKPACKVDMTRVVSSNVASTTATTNHSNGNSTTNGNQIDTSTEPDKSHVSSNRGSIFLTFVSIIMATTVIMHM